MADLGIGSVTPSISCFQPYARSGARPETEGMIGVLERKLGQLNKSGS